MPARAIAASNTSSEPASAPVCDEAARAPGAERPALTSTTGLLRAAARAADMNARCADRLHVHQDRARARVAGQVVQHVAEVDIGVLAE